MSTDIPHRRRAPGLLRPIEHAEARFLHARNKHDSAQQSESGQDALRSEVKDMQGCAIRRELLQAEIRQAGPHPMAPELLVWRFRVRDGPTEDSICLRMLCKGAGRAVRQSGPKAGPVGDVGTPDRGGMGLGWGHDV